MDLRSLDEGRLRHPLFGDREHWYQQNLKPGWFTGSLNDAANSAVVRRELLRALHEVAKKL